MRSESEMNLREAAQQATPREQLLKELMDSRVPKTEREHAAAREIERLRADRGVEAVTQDWDEVEALRESLREHMAEIHRLRAALAQQAEPVEPVAWMSHESMRRLREGGNCKGTVPVHSKPSHTSTIPLYAAPPKRKPLTDEEIEQLMKWPEKGTDLLAFARAIERAHGIGGEE